jgi:hypothetical protein
MRLEKPMNRKKKPGAGSQKPVGRLSCFAAFWLLAAGFWLLSPGCASDNKKPTTQPTSMSQRQDDALRDPFGYKPDMRREDVSGGDIGHLDRDALKKDLNNVFNP